MEYFNDVLTTFLGLEHICLWEDHKALGYHKYILIFVQKLNEGITGLEQHEGE